MEVSMAILNSDRGYSKSHRRCLHCIRFVAWCLALCSLLAVILSFGALADTLPISRWQSAQKSWFLAVRVPLINMLSLAIIEVLSRSVTRYRSDSIAIWVGPFLSITAGIKSVAESVEMLLLPRKSDILFIALVATVIAGITVALWLGRSLLNDQIWRELKTTFGEKIVLFVLVAAILGLNVVLFVQ